MGMEDLAAPTTLAACGEPVWRDSDYWKMSKLAAELEAENVRMKLASRRLASQLRSALGGEDIFEEMEKAITEWIEAHE